MGHVFFTGWIDVLPVNIASTQVSGVEYNVALSTTWR
jgi:hypothetical protein